MLKRKKKMEQNGMTDGQENMAFDNQTIEQATPETLEDKGVESQPGLSEEERLKQELNAINDKYLRLFAEFDNFKRRTSKERIELFKTAGKEVLTALLPVLDDFDRALKSFEYASEPDPVKDGIQLIQTKLKAILAQQGLKEMQSVGEVFNTDLHEAVTQIPAPSEDLKGKVIDEMEKGYFLNDKVIRFAKVIVGI